VASTLEFISDGGNSRTWSLAAGTTRVGRAPDNDLVIPEPAVSSYHLVLESSGSSLVVRDLGSTNGSFVNEQPVKTPVQLRDGDLLRIGLHVRARVHIGKHNGEGPRYWLFHENSGRTWPVTGSVELNALLSEVTGELEGEPEDEEPPPFHLRVVEGEVEARGVDGVARHALAEVFALGPHRVAVLDAHAARARTETGDQSRRWTLWVDIGGLPGPTAKVLDPEGNVQGKIRAANRVAVLHVLVEHYLQDGEGSDRGWCPDETLMRGVWGRQWNQKGPASFQVLIHRIRKDLARAGLTGALIEKRSGFSRLRPGRVRLVQAGDDES
jgi:hypothetical protein